MACDGSIDCGGIKRPVSLPAYLDGGKIDATDNRSKPDEYIPASHQKTSVRNSALRSRKRKKKRDWVTIIAAVLGALTTLILLFLFRRRRGDDGSNNPSASQKTRRVGSGPSSAAFGLVHPSSPSRSFAQVAELRRKMTSPYTPQVTEDQVVNRLSFLMGSTDSTDHILGNTIADKLAFQRAITRAVLDAWNGTTDEVRSTIAGKRDLAAFLDQKIARAVAEHSELQEMIAILIEARGAPTVRSAPFELPVSDDALRTVRESAARIAAEANGILQRIQRVSPSANPLGSIALLRGELFGTTRQTLNLFSRLVKNFEIWIFDNLALNAIIVFNALIEAASTSHNEAAQSAVIKLSDVLGLSGDELSATVSSLFSLNTQLAESLKTASNTSETAEGVLRAQQDWQSIVLQAHRLLRHARHLLEMLRDATCVAEAVQRYGTARTLPDLVRQLDLSNPSSTIICLLKLFQYRAGWVSTVISYKIADEASNIKLSRLNGQYLMLFFSDLLKIVLAAYGTEKLKCRRDLEIACRVVEGRTRSIAFTLAERGGDLRTHGNLQWAHFQEIAAKHPNWGLEVGKEVTVHINLERPQVPQAPDSNDDVTAHIVDAVATGSESEDNGTASYSVNNDPIFAGAQVLFA